MSRGKITLAAYALIMLLFPSLSTAGKTGAEFLNFETGARPASLSGAFTAVADDINTLRHNPAGAGRAVYNQVLFMHNHGGEGITHQHAAFMRPVGLLNGGAGVSLSYFRVGGVTGYTEGGEETGSDVRAESFAFTVSFGAPLAKSLYGGINTKLISEYLDKYSASAVAFDTGILWESPLDGLSLGSSLRNLGGRLTFIEESSPLPLEMTAGAAWRFDLLGAAGLASLEGVFPYHYTSHLNLGAELEFFDFISARAGYTGRDHVGGGLRLGGGVKTGGLSLDYAWLPGGDFENSHRLSLNFRFGRKFGEMKVEQDIRRHFESGERLYRAGRLLEAYREFSIVTTLAPRHREAADYMSRIELRVEDAQLAALVEENIEAGEKYFRAGRLGRATEKFENVLALQPEHPEALRYLGLVRERFQEVADALLDEVSQAYDAGNYEETLDRAERVLLLDEDNEEALEYRNLAEKRIRELEELRRQREEEQRRRLREINITRSLEQGRANMDRSRYADAMENFSEVLKLDPESHDALAGHTRAGIALAEEKLERENFIEARKAIESVLRRDPDSEEALSAKEGIDAVLRDRASVLNRQGLSLYAEGRLEEAVGVWEKALGTYPAHETARQNLNRARQELED